MSSVISAGEGSSQEFKGGAAHSTVGDTTQTTGAKTFNFAAPNRDAWKGTAIWALAAVVGLAIWKRR